MSDHTGSIVHVVTTEPRAAKLLDEVIVLLAAVPLDKLDYSITDEAFRYIVQARREHRIELTVALARELRRRGLLGENE